MWNSSLLVLIHSFLLCLLNPIKSKPIASDDLYLHSISKCCEITIRLNETELLKCVNASAEQTIQAGWQQQTHGSSTITNIKNPSIKSNSNNKNSNKKLKLAFVTYGTDDIIHYSVYAFAINQAYVEQNNHLLRLSDPKTSNFEPADVRWNKVKILELALKTWAKSCDYIIWLDADLIILDLHMDLDSLIQQYPNYHLLASASPESTTNTDVMNSGMLILKNSKFINEWLLKLWWNYEKRHVYSDQEVFNMLYTKYSDKLASTIVILPPDTINSNPPATLKQTNVGQVLHLMGEYDVYRHLAFKSGFNEICRVVEFQNSHSHNLNSINNNSISINNNSSINNFNSNHSNENSSNNTTITTTNNNNSINDNNNMSSSNNNNNSNNNKLKLQHQLGLHQERLLAISFLHYSNQSFNLLTHFQNKLHHHQFNPYLEYSGLTYYIKRYIDMLYDIESKWSAKELKALYSGRWTKLDNRLLKDQLAVDKQYARSNSSDSSNSNRESNSNRVSNNNNNNNSYISNNNANADAYVDSIFPNLQEYKDRNQSILGSGHNRTADEWRVLVFQLLMQNLELYGSSSRNDDDDDDDDHSDESTKKTSNLNSNDDDDDDDGDGQFDNARLKDSQSCSNDNNDDTGQTCNPTHTDSDSERYTDDDLTNNNDQHTTTTATSHRQSSSLSSSSLQSRSKSIEEERFDRASVLYFTIDFGATLVKHYLVNKINHHHTDTDTKKGNRHNNDDDDDDEEIQSILTQLLTLSNELILIVEYHRKPHIHHLRADLFIDQSVLTRHRLTEKNKKSKNPRNGKKENKKKNIDTKGSSKSSSASSSSRSSIDYLYQALHEKEQEAKQLGELCLIKVLILISDQLSQSQQFHSSFPHFQRAVEIHEKNLGISNQVVLGTYYFMYGQAKASVKEYPHAIQLFLQAKRIFELFPTSSEYYRDLPRVKQLIQYCQERL